MARVALKVTTPGSAAQQRKKKKDKRGRPSLKRAGRPFAPRRKTYTELDMLEAIRLVIDGECSIQAAAKHINSEKKNPVPRMTLSDRLKSKDPAGQKKLGRPQELSDAVEAALIKCLVKCGEFNYPMRKADLQDVVQSYLTEHDIVSRFPNSRPAREWCRAFLKRHRGSVKLRKPSNIRRCRGKVSPEIIRAYFEKLAVSLEGIPAHNIFNYDETNLRDDPGAEKAFFEKNTRYCEKIRDSSKVAFSVMFCVSASGDMLPPCTVYKSATDTVYTRWAQGGPVGSVYAASKSGWYDIPRFNIWFEKVMLPYIEKLPR